LFFISSHHCWWTMQSQCDRGCVLIWKRDEKLCSPSLVDTVISEQSANGLSQFQMKMCHSSSSNFWNTEEFNMHIFGWFKTEKIDCSLVILVMSNIFECQKYWNTRPYFSELTFQDTEDFYMYTVFLFFFGISNFCKCQKSHHSHHGLPVNSHANTTYSFPILKIILIPTMTRSNCFWFISLTAHTAPPMPETILLYWTFVLPTHYTYYGIRYYKVSEC
jgi:hypothetical protein